MFRGLIPFLCTMQYPNDARSALGFEDGPCVSNRNVPLNFTASPVQKIQSDTLYGSVDGLQHTFSLRVYKHTNVSNGRDC